MSSNVTFVNQLLSVAAERHLTVILLCMNIAFQYGSMRCNVYAELPRQDPRHGDCRRLGNHSKAMYKAWDAPQTWANTVKEGKYGRAGSKASELHPPACWSEKRGSTLVVRVDDFMRRTSSLGSSAC